MAILANPRAGALKRAPRMAERLRSACARTPGAGWFAAEDETQLAEAVEHIVRARVSRVGVLGGDGTASVVLTALRARLGAARLPAIALLRGGTMNTVANSMGIRRASPLQLLRRALHAWNNGGARYQRRPTLDVQGRLGFLFGTGVMYGFLAEYYAQGGDDPTPATAVRVLARSVASSFVNGKTITRILDPRPIGVRFGEGAWEPRRYLTIGAGTVAQAGLGFAPFARCEESRERFHLLAIKGGPSDVARDLPRIWLGRGMRDQTAYETTTAWADLSAEEAFGYFVDGDLLTASGQLSLRRGPVLDILSI